MSDQVPPESPSPYPRPTDVGTPSMMGAPTAEEKTQSTLLWVLTIFASFIPGLIFFLIGKDKPYVYRNAAMALTFSIVLIALGIILSITVVGLILLPLVWVLGLVIPIMGAVAANKGEAFNPPVLPGLTEKIFKV
jgi:uncharacterized protein